MMPSPETNSDIMIEGALFAPQSSTSHEARLYVFGDDYRIESQGDYQGTSLSGARTALRIEPPLGSSPRKIYLPDGQMFETKDLAQTAQLEGGKGFWARLSKTERFGWHLLPIAILTPILAFGFYRLMIPLFISAAMFMTPDAMLRSIDKNTIKTMDLKLTQETTLSAERQEEVAEIFQALKLIAAERSSKTRRIPEYKLLFRESKLFGPNAFALPGGTIVMTDELIELFPEQDYVLAAVLAHEIGHVEHEHSLRQMYRALGMAAMIGLIAGDAGPMLEEIILEGSALLSLSFSREHEMESDNFSFDLLSETGRRTDGLIAFFEKLDEKVPNPKSGEWMMSHPLSDKRIENIKARMEEVPAK